MRRGRRGGEEEGRGGERWGGKGGERWGGWGEKLAYGGRSWRMVGGIELLRRLHSLRVPHKAVEIGAQATVGPAEERIYDIVAMVCLAECLYVLVSVCVGVCVHVYVGVC